MNYPQQVGTCKENLEEALARTIREHKLYKDIKDSLEALSDIHGGYTLHEFKAEYMYAAAATRVRYNKKHIKRMLKEQKKRK